MVFQQKWLHGSKNPQYIATYNTWADMRKRCYNKNTVNYPAYGGRRITICARWLDDFDAFVEDMGVKPTNKTIDRKNNEGNYELTNCRWASKPVQARNTRANRLITYKGREQPITDVAKLAGMKVRTLTTRLRRGWTLEQALSRPVRPMKVVKPSVCGTASKYSLGCRCDPCVEAAKIYNRTLHRQRYLRKGENVGP